MRLIILIFSVLFSYSCKEVDLPADIDQPLASCTVNGSSFSASSIDLSLNDLDMMTIGLIDDEYNVSIRVYNFSDKNINEPIYFSVPGMGIVSFDDVTYTNFYNPPYEGEIIFTDLSPGSLSGTFHFKGQDVVVGSFMNVNVLDGSFENLTY
tara:strand:+ start:58 stop:513 length:456 start_codon:yes stop_codon:yes gene_type:complete